MSTITLSNDLRTVVKNLKQFGIGNNISSLPRNEQKAIFKEFAQKTDGSARKPITSPKEYWQ
jgi:hypothetical protein